MTGCAIFASIGAAMLKPAPFIEGDFLRQSRLLPRWMAKPQVWIWLSLFAVSLLIQLFYSPLGRPPMVMAGWHQHLGGEYFNIARAIVDGRGFSDPFGEATGPTAWMPPLFPAILAALLAITGSREAVAMVVLGLTHAAVATIGTTVYSIARRHARAVPPLLVVLITAVWVAAFSDWLVMITQDIWLTALGVNATLVLICRRIERGEMKIWPWALVGALLLFTSPALLVAWLVVVAFFAVQDRQWRRWGAVIGLVVLIGVPWTVRNALALHAFVPVKSNLAYDAYFSNVVDEDGIHDDKTLMVHPYTNALPRFDYASMGEIEFNRHYGEVLSEYLDKHSGSALRKVANRAIAATIKYRPIALDDRGAGLWLSRLVYCLPIIAFLTLALLSERYRKITDCCCLFCAAYLGPYVLIAFYVRYWLALTPIFLLVIFFATDTVVERLRHRRSVSSDESLVDAFS